MNPSSSCGFMAKQFVLAAVVLAAAWLCCVIPLSATAKGNPYGFIFPDDCHPLNTLNISQCRVLMPNCATFGGDMKWTGPGCKYKHGPKKGRRMQDGGCQCAEYCGYRCPEACNRDNMCTWSRTLKHCVYKQSPTTKGFPILNCAPQ